MKILVFSLVITFVSSQIVINSLYYCSCEVAKKELFCLDLSSVQRLCEWNQGQCIPSSFDKLCLEKRFKDACEDYAFGLGIIYFRKNLITKRIQIINFN